MKRVDQFTTALGVAGSAIAVALGAWALLAGVAEGWAVWSAIAAVVAGGASLPFNIRSYRRLRESR